MSYIDAAGRRLRISAETASKTEAIALLERRRVDAREGKLPEATKIKPVSLGEFAARYTECCRSQAGWEASKKFYVQRLVARFGQLTLPQFTTYIVERYREELLAEGLKPASVNRVLGVLKHMIGKAWEWDMLGEATLKAVRRVKPLKENNKRLRYLTDEQLEKLIAACGPPEKTDPPTPWNPALRVAVVLAAYTGMRQGEILALRWDHVDLEHGLVLIDRSKNGERREVPLRERPIEELRALRQRLQDELDAPWRRQPDRQAIQRRIDSPWVFCYPTTGERLTTIQHAWEGAVRRSGILDFRFHDLRHYAAHRIMPSRCVEAGRCLLFERRHAA